MDVTNENLASSAATLELIGRFNAAFNAHDVDRIMSLMTDDCVFENTRPAPDGERLVGRAAVRRAWEELFRRSPRARFEAEEVFACRDRAVVRWVYSWIKEDGSGHVRGVDIFRVEGGRIAEKLSYVKG